MRLARLQDDREEDGACAHLKTLARKGFRFCELGLVVPQVRKSDETFGHFGAIGSASGLALCERSFQQRIRSIVLAELIVVILPRVW